MAKKITIYTDGGARGNPGPAGIGVVIYHDGDIVEKYSEKIGEATNNYAEYSAVVKAMELARKYNPDEINFKLDSELVVQQLNQKYKIKNQELGKLFIKIWNARQSFQKVTFDHVPRAENKMADFLVNQALDNKK